MIKRHGKRLDISTFKQPVLADLTSHVAAVASMAAYLAEHESALAQTRCYICGSERSHPMATIHGFTYVECDGCSHVYTSKRYSEDAIARFYEQNDYYARITYANKETCFYRREEVARPKFLFAEPFAEPRGAWLDVGSGIGDLVSVAAERGWTATGLELSDTSVAFAREVFGVDLVHQTLERYAAADPARACTFRAVSFLGVLEHGVDPLRELRTARTLLEPGGIVLIQVPNARSASSLIQAAFPEHVFRHMSPVSHVMLFTERSLHEALRLTGFEPVAMWYLGLDAYELVNTLTAVNPRVQGSPLQRLFLDRFNELQLAFDAIEMSDGLICVARTLPA